MKSIKAMARMEVLTKHQMSWKADANSPQQMEAEALFNTIDTLGDGNGTLELYEVVLYVQVRQTEGRHIRQSHKADRGRG